MNRKSLRPQLNQVRSWTRQGRTDAWIAHQLEVTVQQIQKFKSDYGLGSSEVESEVYDDQIDLRAEDEKQIAAELEAEAQVAPVDEENEEVEEEEERPRRRRRRRRRKISASPSLEATFEHGDEGYGLWIDPAIKDDAIYAEHWAGHRSVEVILEEDQIIIRRAGKTSS